MWVPKAVIEWFHISKDAVSTLQSEKSALTVERDILKHQLTIAQSNFDWLKQRVYQLEVERAQLIKKAYNIDTAVPEIVRTTGNPKDVLQLTSAIFEDVGEEQARELGMPAYGPLSVKTN